MEAVDKHCSVLLNEAVEGLAVQPEGCYIDATFGRGGHSRAILQRLGDRGCLIAVDRDRRAFESGQGLAAEDQRFAIFHGSFAAQLPQLSGRQVNGILFDLGVSSPQLDDAVRGFSFMQDGPLDMRMDDEHGQTAEEWLNTAKEEEISRVLWGYGEERFARRIARAIVSRRQQHALKRTTELAGLIAAAMPRHDKHKHPATRSFQAIRIFINAELDELRQALKDSVELLVAGGRLVVISFHSLEDRLVKQFIRDMSRGQRLPAGLPVQHEQSNAVLRPIGKAIFASSDEVAANPRARSAVMRVAEKL